MNTTYDPEADAVFFKLSDEPYVESEDGPPGVTFDFDAEGRITAIEVLRASKVLAPGDWRTAPRPGDAKAHAAE